VIPAAAQNNHQCDDSQQGFTLLELVVAMAIFSIMSMMAYGGLNAVLNTHQHVGKQAKRLTELQTAFTFIGRDIEQTVARPIRDQYGDRVAALTSSNTRSGALIELTRTGRRNPGGYARSNLQRVAYLLDENRLMRLSWPTIDRAQDGEANETVLIDEVESVEIRYLDEQLKWQPNWPMNSNSSNLGNNNANSKPHQLPRAVELSVEIKGWGTIVRLFRVPEI